MLVTYWSLLNKAHLEIQLSSAPLEQAFCSRIKLARGPKRLRERHRMDHFGGSWPMISNVPNHGSNPSTPSNQDPNLFMPQQQFSQQQQQQQFNQQQFYPQQQQQQQPQQRFPQQPHQSLPSHFNLLHLVENLAEITENGTRDQHSDALVAELTSQFDNCQQLLNSISGSINSRSMTFEGQKRRLEECEHLQNQRRDLISKYRNSVEELVNAEL